MKILIHDYAGHPFQIQLSRELAQSDDLVIHAYAGGLLTPQAAMGNQPDDPSSLSVRMIPIDSRYRQNKYKYLKRRGYELDYGRRLVELIRLDKPDVVLCANTPSEILSMASRATHESGGVFIPWIQDFYAEAVARSVADKWCGLGKVVGAYYRKIEASTIRKSEQVIAITTDFIPLLEQYSVDQKRVTVIPNWSPLEQMPQRPRDNAWAESHALCDKKVFLYSGTLGLKHRPELLLNLASRYHEDPRVRVVVVSEGPGMEFLQKAKEAASLTNLILLPFQPFEELPYVMASADVLIALLEPDAGIYSVPSKVLTYLCAGRPILASIPTKNLAARIIIEEGVGYCSEPNDEKRFLHYSEKLINTLDNSEEYGKLARTYAENNFDIKRIASKFKAVFHEALKR